MKRYFRLYFLVLSGIIFPLIIFAQKAENPESNRNLTDIFFGMFENEEKAKSIDTNILEFTSENSLLLDGDFISLDGLCNWVGNSVILEKPIVLMPLRETKLIFFQEVTDSIWACRYRMPDTTGRLIIYERLKED